MKYSSCRAMRSSSIATFSSGSLCRPSSSSTAWAWIGMQNEDRVQRFGQHRIDFVFLGRNRESHAQEVFSVAQLVARIHKGLAGGISVSHGRDGRHFGDQPMAGHFALLGIVNVGTVV